jgi:hypothetical protein
MGPFGGVHRRLFSQTAAPLHAIESSCECHIGVTQVLHSGACTHINIYRST